MQQLTFIKPGQLEWWDVLEPKLEGPKQAIVRPVAVATCDLDAAIIQGRVPFRGPFAFGHEFVAEVVEVGEEVKGIRPGQRVIVPFQISCGECRYCLRGQTGDCANVKELSSYGLGNLGGKWGGALSELVRVPFAEAMLVALPPGINPASVASASDNLPDAWRTVGPYLEQQPESPVLIAGGGMSGSIGLYAVGIAKALGASQIDYLDNDLGRLELAKSLGANPRLSSRTLHPPGWVVTPLRWMPARIPPALPVPCALPSRVGSVPASGFIMVGKPPCLYWKCTLAG